MAAIIGMRAKVFSPRWLALSMQWTIFEGAYIDIVKHFISPPIIRFSNSVIAADHKPAVFLAFIKVQRADCCPTRAFSAQLAPEIVRH